jgi:Galactose oxidase, central domain
MTDKQVTLKVANKPPELFVTDQKQRLYLNVTSANYKDWIRISGKLGDTAEDLMTANEFTRIKRGLKLSPPGNISQKEPALIKSNTIWCIDIKFNKFDDKGLSEITLEFPEFKVSPIGETKEARTKIDATGPNNASLHSVDVKKQKAQPRIKSFESDKCLKKAGPFTMSWAIESETSDFGFKLLEKKIDGPETLVAEDKSGKKVGSVERSVAAQTDFSLKLTTGAGEALTTGAGEVLERSLRVYAFTKNEFGSYSPLLKDVEGGIFGLYAHEGSDNLPKPLLLALLQDGPNKASASLWKTSQGFLDNKWEREGSIPLESARRPGIIFKDTLWLIGGDCANPDPGREAFNVGSYILNRENTKFEDLRRPRLDELEENMAEQKIWPPDRMGHALVKLDKDRLWVMGGFAQDGGARNDIWEFDGEEWTELKKPSGEPRWEPRCLFGATVTSKAVWIAGGFDSPGSAMSYDDIWRYDKTGKKWEKLRITIKPDEDESAQYCACMLFTVCDNPCAITTYYRPSNNRYLHHVHHLARGGEASDSYPVTSEAGGIFQRHEYYRMDSVVLDGIVFFRYLAGNDRIMRKDITYLVPVLHE